MVSQELKELRKRARKHGLTIVRDTHIPNGYFLVDKLEDGTRYSFTGVISLDEVKAWLDDLDSNTEEVNQPPTD